MTIPPPETWNRVSFLVPGRLRTHINEFQFQNYIQSRGEAVRRLLRSGLLYEQLRGHYHTAEPITTLNEEKEK